VAKSEKGSRHRLAESEKGSRHLPGAPMSKSRVLSEFLQFLKQEKKYWLVPIVIVFVLFGLLIVFSQSSAVAPFIYTLF
jgi:hypothetical protein